MESYAGEASLAFIGTSRGSMRCSPALPDSWYSPSWFTAQTSYSARPARMLRAAKQRGHHGVVLIVVLVHAVAAHQVKVGTMLLQRFAHSGHACLIGIVIHRVSLALADYDSIDHVFGSAQSNLLDFLFGQRDQVSVRANSIIHRHRSRNIPGHSSRTADRAPSRATTIYSSVPARPAPTSRECKSSYR